MQNKSLLPPQTTSNSPTRSGCVGTPFRPNSPSRGAGAQGVHVCAHTCTRSHTHTRLHAHVPSHTRPACTHAHTHSHPLAHTCRHPFIYTCTHPLSHTCLHTCTHQRACTCTHAPKHTHRLTNTHTYTPAHKCMPLTHTHAHTHSHSLPASGSGPKTVPTGRMPQTLPEWVIPASVHRVDPSHREEGPEGDEFCACSVGLASEHPTDSALCGSVR